MIFTSYTGNAMLNNALMTIEALGNLKEVSEVTPETLLSLYQRLRLKELNKRLKSYTMLFSLNNPLVNPAKKMGNAGENTYNDLITSILNSFEKAGSKKCEISGLEFEKTFESFYSELIVSKKELVRSNKLDPKEEKKQINNLDNTDFTLNRSWFPLIGGLGSDAQALPQAKYSIQIHPICIVIMQFLPLSAFLYKGPHVLLVDSSNFEFTRRFIAMNVKEIQKRIQATSVKDPIENVRDFSKGNYLLRAIQVLENKELDEEYSDLNLWSFSNSGTGASCEIDRVPNSLIKKLVRLNNNPNVSPELVKILSNTMSAYKFLECLEDNIEWSGLYPAVFGTGKKRIEYEGVSVQFLEAYFKEINSPQKITYAKYLAYLINKYKATPFEKYLSKSDAWNEKEYRSDLFAVLTEATRNGEWSLHHHCEVLDYLDQVPVKNFYYNIHRITHFYYQKVEFDSQLPEPKKNDSLVLQNLEWAIALIQNDLKKDTFIKDFTNDQKYDAVGYHELLIRSSKYTSLTLEIILSVFYDENLKISWFSMNELLRIFFNQKEQTHYEVKDFERSSNWLTDSDFQYWKNKLKKFIEDYQNYYLDKYSNKQTEKKPYGKLLTQIDDIPRDNGDFVRWLEEAVNNVNAYSQVQEKTSSDKWLSDDLLYNPLGKESIPFARFTIKFLMHKQYYFSTIK